MLSNREVSNLPSQGPRVSELDAQTSLAPVRHPPLLLIRPTVRPSSNEEGREIMSNDVVR